MPFLRINGFPIPTKSFNEKPFEVGSRNRAFDGSPLVDRRRVKGVWDGETPPLLRWEATAVRALMLGQGDVWPFDSGDYSGKGLPAKSGAVRTIRSAGADGDEVADEYKFTGAVAVESAVTNILGADERDAEAAPSGYLAINGATLAGDTSNYWQGTKSLKVTTDSSGSDQEGAYTNSADPGAGSAGKTYTGSVYMKGGAGSESISMTLYDVTNAASSSGTTATLSATEWTRVTESITIGGSDCRALQIRVREENADSGYDFYCDGFQIEERGFATSWVDGSRSAGHLRYDGTFLNNHQDLTINFWARMESDNSSSDRMLVSLYQEYANEWIRVYRQGSSNNTVFRTIDATGTVDNSITDTTTWDGDWHMITVVMRTDPETGIDTKELYVDGASSASSSPAALPKLAVINAFDIGNSWGSYLADGALIDDLAAYPFAANDALVSTWYAMGKAMATAPKFYVDGNAIRADNFTKEAVGTVKSCRTVQAVRDNSWQTNMEQIQFTIEET